MFLQATKLGINEEQAMELAVDLDALDFELEGECLNLEVAVSEVANVADKLRGFGFEIVLIFNFIFISTRFVAFDF